MAPAHSLDFEVAVGTDSAQIELDLEAIITWFAGDDSCSSHALPTSLSAEQRQLLKQIAKRFSNLHCESYGFGAERRLHLFKKRAHGVRTRVKNTFIDAWVEAVENKSTSPPLARSLPADLRNIVESASVPMKPKRMQPSLSCTSHPDEVENVAPMCSTPSPCLSPKHVSSLGVANLIQQCPESQPRNEPPLTDADAYGFAPTAPPPTSPGNVARLPTGTAVEIDGLLRRPDFNGAAGIVLSWDSTMRRYNILLDSSGIGEVQRQVKAKRENLRLRTPPPPSSSAATDIKLDACIPICGENTTCDFVTPGDEMLSSALSASEWNAWPLCDPSMQGSIDERHCASPLSDVSITAGFGWVEPLCDASMRSPFNITDGIDVGWSIQYGSDNHLSQGGWHQDVNSSPQYFALAS